MQKLPSKETHSCQFRDCQLSNIRRRGLNDMRENGVQGMVMLTIVAMYTVCKAFPNA